MMEMELRDRKPHDVQVAASLSEGLLPAVSGTLRLTGIDENLDRFTIDVAEVGTDDMLWDTGSDTCIITNDLLPEKFKEYLQTKMHDPYRSASGTRVQVDAYIALSNSKFEFNTVFTVVPPSSVPNCRSGVILGQNGFINHLVYTQIPRSIMERRGEDIQADKWGVINILEFVDTDGDLHTF